MTWVALSIGGSAVLGYMGSRGQADAATQAAQMQYGATQDAARQQREMFDILNAQQAPYRAAGGGALTSLQNMLPYFTEKATPYKMPAAYQMQAEYRPFTAQDLKSNLAPNYEFMKQQGLGATAQAMNPGGGGSNIDLARTKFAEEFAGNAYQNALQNYMGQQQQGFNQRFTQGQQAFNQDLSAQQQLFNQGQSERTNIYNKLAGMAGIGQTAANQTATLGTGTAGNLGQLAIGGATAIGAGNIGAANAMAGGYQNIGNAATLASMLSPQGSSYSPSQIANANAMNVPSTPRGPLSSDFNRYLVG